ncbi:MULTISPECIES: O-methyltransferase [Paenibacillus]|uniref:O-methyltransferase n=1 Tax=Paenibacillus lutrae TaxID=2078573 RepID=A0A7X3K151_9BACL|nr:MULTISPECIES: O-methyltransferase [Paenibacillus]MVP01777.1 O-methyltransferase [Paenibacillus lutrae]
MIIEPVSLVRQVEIVFKELRQELGELNSGTVFLQIRNNSVGKFGVRHNPLESRNGLVHKVGEGLAESQWQAFRQLALDSLKYKVNWTHGEITFDFTVKKDTLYASVMFESNYNMSNLL